MDSAYIAAQQQLIQIAIDADPTSEIVSYLTSMLQAELNAEQEKIAALGAYQIASMMEGLSIYDQNDPRYLAMLEELAWLTDMVATRNEYYGLLAAATLNYNTTVYNAMGSYNASTLAAQATYQMTQIQNAADYGRQVRSAQYSYSRAEAARSNTLQIALINAAFDEWGAVADYEADLAISRLSSFLDQLDSIESDDNLTPSGLGDAYDSLSSAFSGSGPGSTDFAAQQAALRQSTENAANAASSAAAASNAAAFRQSTTAADADYLSKSYLASAAYTAALAPLYSSYLATVEAAELAYSEELCRLEGLFQDALNTGVNNLAEGTGSIDVQVCFVAGFEIELTDGSVKRVEEFEGGEEVWARPHDNPTGPLMKCKVVRAFKNGPKETIKVRFENGLELQGTAEHPFFVPEKGWVALKDLEIDDRCVNREGESTKVLSKDLVPGKLPVYNIEVEGGHTYFIGKDGLSVLVHNDCRTGEEQIPLPNVWPGGGPQVETSGIIVGPVIPTTTSPSDPCDIDTTFNYYSVASPQQQDYSGWPQRDSRKASDQLKLPDLQIKPPVESPIFGRWTHPNDMTYDSLRAFGLRPIAAPEIMPGERGYNPFPGVPKPPGIRIFNYKGKDSGGGGYLNIKPSSSGGQIGIGSVLNW